MRKEDVVKKKSREITAIEMDIQEIQITNYQMTTLKRLIEKIF